MQVIELFATEAVSVIEGLEVIELFPELIEL
jgi:hypothetical protein